MFENILIYFVVIPLVMLGLLALCRDIKQIRAVAVVGSLGLIALSVYLLVDYLGLRAAATKLLCSTPAHGYGSSPSTSTSPWV